MDVILVDAYDRKIGAMEKIAAHRLGKLHRAFSVFVFNSKRELLMQKRSLEKYHSAGLWSNTCCSHSQGKNIKEEAEKRLEQEMGIDVSLTEKFSFTYKADLDNNMVENEYDHVFFGHSDEDPKPDPEEVSDWRWVSIEELREDIQKFPQKYTVWLKISLDRVSQELNK